MAIGDPVEGKDINFNAENVEIRNNLVEKFKEEAAMLTDSVNAMMTDLEAKKGFIDGDADELYRKRAKCMHGLSPSRDEAESKLEKIYLLTDYWRSASPLNRLLEAAQYTIDTAAEEGLADLNDGTNFPQETIFHAVEGVFYLTKNESQKVPTFYDNFLKAHKFDSNILDKTLEEVLPKHLSEAEIQKYSQITEYAYATVHNKLYPDMDPEVSSRIQQALDDVQYVFDQTKEPRFELVMAHNRLEFLISCLGLARLKFISDRIDEDSDYYPRAESDWANENNVKLYDFSGYNIPSEDAEAAKEKYLSWMKLEDKPEGESDGN